MFWNFFVVLIASISEFYTRVLCAASVWQLCKPPVHASVCQSDVCGKISSEKLHPQGFLSLRSNTLSTRLVGKNFEPKSESSSLLSRRSRKTMATRGMLALKLNCVVN